MFNTIKSLICIFNVTDCAGFSWDKVSFHKKLVGLTQTATQMGYSIPCDAMLSI